MKYLSVFALLLTSLYCHGANHQEVVVNNSVSGTWTKTDDSSCGRVLILHGYQDHRDGVGNIQTLLAEELSAVGIESLRIDFRGEGERNGYRVTSTIGSRLEDSAAAYQTLSAGSELPTGVFGFRLGGLTAMLLASQNPEWFDTMVVWSAAGNGRSNLVSDDPNMNRAIRQALSTGEAQVQSWTTMTITREFIMSYLGINVLDSLENYPGSFLSIRGDQDFLPSDEQRWIQKLPNEDAAYLTIKDGDHTFRVLEPGNTLHKKVIRETVNFYHSRLCSNGK